MGQKNTLSASPAIYMVDPNLLWERFNDLERKIEQLSGDTGGYVTVKEAAKILRIGQAAVRIAIEEGRLPAKNLARKGAQNAQWRILKSDLNSL